MTPADLELIVADSAMVQEAAERFAVEFYATLFELEPDLRRLFPDDLAAQRRKLLAEFDALVHQAVDLAAEGADRFSRRASDLGGRHADYGVTAAMYEPVGVALLAALRGIVRGFDDDHERAWTRLYRLVAVAMQAG